MSGSQIVPGREREREPIDVYKETAIVSARKLDIQIEPIDVYKETAIVSERKLDIFLCPVRKMFQ